MVKPGVNTVAGHDAPDCTAAMPAGGPTGEHSLRVLHSEWSLGWGGQEIRILAEMKAFRERGIGMALACRKGSCIGSEAELAGFPVYRLPFAGRLDPATILGLRRLVREGRFSLLHTHSSIDGWCGGLAGRWFGLPVVRSRHLSSTVRPGLNARLVYDWLPDAVISSGRHIRDHLVRNCRCRPENHFSVPAGADHRLFTPDLDPVEARVRLGLGASHPVIGIVAVLRSWKGHRILFEACARLLPRFPGLRLLVVGDGPLRDQMPAWANASGLGRRVIFTGHREDVPNCMKAMDVCVLPSLRNEATSQVMPQAMLVGTPVVCSSAGGLTEVVQDGVTGRVVPPGDVPALAQALTDCLLEPLATARMARQARQHALANLTFEQQIRDTLEIYRRVMNRRSLPRPGEATD